MLSQRVGGESSGGEKGYRERAKREINGLGRHLEGSVET